MGDWDEKADFMRRVGATHAEWRSGNGGGAEVLTVLVLAPAPAPEPAREEVDPNMPKVELEELRIGGMKNTGSRLFRVKRPGVDE